MASFFPSHLKIFPHFLSPHHFSRPFLFPFSQTPRYSPHTTKPLHGKPHQSKPRALREWQEYEDAVKRKDLARALRFLKSLEENFPVELFADDDSSSPYSSVESARSRLGELGLVGWERDWEVLDTCLNADDMKLVGSAYGFLKDRGFLPNFGKCRNIVLDGPRDVTPSILKSSTGLEGAVPYIS